MRKKDDLDKLIEKITKKDLSFKEELGHAERAWDIAFQIKDLRKARGLTQKRLAHLAKTSQAAIARLEDAQYSGYTLSTLEKIAKALNAKVDLFIIPKEKEKKFNTLFKLRENHGLLVQG